MYLPGVCTYVLTQVLVHTYIRTYIRTYMLMHMHMNSEGYVPAYIHNQCEPQPTPNMPSREVGLAVVIDIIPEG